MGPATAPRLTLFLLVFAACDRVVAPVIDGPTNLTYELDPSGDPDSPAGVLLRWDPVISGNLSHYNVYSRPGPGGSYDRRGSTTSITFHDVGIPDLDYYVTAVTVSGEESAASNVVRIDERLRLSRPAFLETTSLNTAIHLAWDDTPFTSEPAGFRQYRVYSASYSLDANLCGEHWFLEGTTVAPRFLAAALTNGVPRCFAVSAESIEGWESLWSPVHHDTPRYDARNVLMWAHAVDPSRSGFRFQFPEGGMGVITSGDRTDIDFWLYRDPLDGAFFMVPERAGTEVALYGNEPIADLTSIDVAPTSGYDRSAIQALPMWGYVFRMTTGDGFYRFGGLRVTHVGTEYMIFDWSYQTDPGNPELLRLR